MDQRSKIAILGYGAEGKATLQWLKKHEYNNITVCDENVDLKDEMPDGVSVRLGPNYMDELTDFEVIFRTPGISYLTREVQSAKANGAEVTSTTAFFVDQCPCPTIGVSGTKGKGTTATLIYEMLKKAKKDVYLGGNIGNPPLEFLDKLSVDSLVVLELSSFQLQDMNKSPKYAILLNTGSDHLDYHADQSEYLQAKEALLAHQDEDGFAVLNNDYPYVKYYEGLVKGEKKLVSTKKKVKNGAFIADGAVYFVKNGDEEKILPFQSGFGQTLLVWYYENEKFPTCLYEDIFLYDIYSQGYKYCQGRGFGYFREYEELLRTLKENKLGSENVIAFSWESKKENLLDITPQVRTQIKASPSVLEH